APDAVDRELQERAKKALQKGKKPASRAMINAFKSIFNGESKESEAARLCCYQIWSSMGTNAVDTRDPKYQYDLSELLKYASTQLQAEKSQANRTAATEARIAVLGK